MKRFIAGALLQVLFSPVFAQTCLPPAALTATNISQNAAVLSWNAVSNANRYYLQWKHTNSASWTMVTTYMATSYSVTGLMAGNSYSFRVSVSCNGGNSSVYSAPYNFTATASTTCAIPGNLAASSITQSSARLTWNAIAGARTYTLQWQASGSNNWTSVSNLTTPSYNFGWLTAGTSYSFRVSAVCNDGSSTNYSNAYHFTTAATTACVAPTNLEATNITQTSALLSWTAAPSAHRYILQWQPAGTINWITVPDLMGTSYNLTGLTAGAAYAVRVSTICSDGNSSSNSSSYNFTAAKCAAPAGLTANSSRTSARVSWNAVPGVQRYTLQWQLTGAINWTTVPDVSAVAYDIENLMAGSAYSFRVSAVCTGGINSNFSAPYSFNTSNCAVPSGLTTISISQSSALLSWNTSVGAHRYTVQWKRANETNWNTVVSMATTSYDLTGLTSGTVYSFRVSAICSDGNSSAYSSSYNFTTDGCATPDGLTAIDITQTSARLSWNASPAANRYIVQWKLASATNWTRVPDQADSWYHLTGLTAGNAYSFRVSVICDDGTSSSISNPYNFAAARTATCPVPGNAQTGNITGTSALLSWNAVPDAQRYTLQWRLSGATNWITVAGITTSSYTLSGLTPGTVYSFQVSATCNDGSNTGYGSAIHFTTHTATASCSVPGNLAATNVTGSFASLSWNAVAGAQAYTLQWQPAGEMNWTSITALTSASYGLSGLAAGTGYLFRVSAVCHDGTSTKSSSPYSFTTTGCVTPSGLTATNITNNSGTLSWSAIAGVRSYVLQWQPVGALSWTSVNSVNASYNLSGLRAGTAHRFEVTAICNNGTSSINSSPFSFTTATSACTAPTNLGATNITGTSARLTWTAVTGAQSYTVQMQLFGTTNWVVVDTARTNSFNLSRLISGTAYSFRVSATCSNGVRTGYSSPYTFTTTAGLSATNITATSARLSWNAITGAQAYTLQWKTATATSWTTVTWLTATSYDLTALIPGTAYTFRVSATFPSGGTSGYSNPYNFTTVSEFSDSQIICGNSPTPTGWVTIGYGGVCAQAGGFVYFNKTIRKIEGMAAGSTVQICGPEPAPAGWVTIALGNVCATIGNTQYYRKTIKKIEGMPAGSEVQVCGDGENTPADWIVVSRGGVCAQVGNVTYFTKTIKKVSGSVMQICGNQPTPAGWVTTGYGGVCAVIYNVVYYYKIIRSITNMAAGSTIDICGPGPVPAGWITIGFNQQCTTIGNVIYFARTIRKIEGMAVGSTVEICGPDPIPAGWVTISVGGVCNVIGNTHYYRKTVKKIDGMPAGSDVQVCGYLPAPAGWVTIAYGGVCARLENFVYYYKTIRKIEGMSAGSTLQICGSEPTPAGWVTTGIGGVCATIGNIHYYRKSIVKVDGMPAGSEVRVCGSAEPVPSGWVITQPSGGICGMIGSTVYFFKTIRKTGSSPAYNPANNMSTASRPGDDTRISEMDEKRGEKFNVHALQNPSNTDFKIRISSANNEDKIQINVYDVYGRQTEVRANISAGQTISIGHNYVPGHYVLEVFQGNEKKRIRLIKL